MKNKIVGIFCLLLVVCLGCYLLSNSETAANCEKFLRIHIRANSNSDIDQTIKYEVKEAIVNFLAPKLTEATTKEKAKQVVLENAVKLTDIADSTLFAKGFKYKSSVEINAEKFPTRKYDDFILEEGVYDAVIVKLGDGLGDNWWCVVYPPLCFIGGQPNGSNQIKYKSKLKEIVDAFLKEK